MSEPLETAKSLLPASHIVGTSLIYQPLAHFRRNDARDEVGVAASDEAHDRAYDFGRIGASKRRG